MTYEQKPKETHESYGMMSFSRVSGGPGHLFGSSIPHTETIQLTIGQAEIERGLSTDWYYRKKDHIVVEMSQAQFAEAITSMNMGSGVPVTIKRLNGKRMAETKFTNKRIQFEEEFAERMNQLQESMNHLTEKAEAILHSKKAVSKAERTEILNGITRLKTELTSNIPFMSSMYNEQMDKTTQEAKAEVEAFTLNKVSQLGLESLTQLKQLTELQSTRTGKQKEITRNDADDTDS